MIVIYLKEAFQPMEAWNVNVKTNMILINWRGFMEKYCFTCPRSHFCYFRLKRESNIVA